ncbi:MAG: S1 RNA-binding domain-containing protein [Oscillospiraceae bacterium]|jgi:S1 RNA binding domain protein
MQLEVGSVLEGKVTKITKFGAFVALPEGKSGLVHISEIANTYVNDVHDHVQEGQTVKVKVIGIGGDGKINLSIKKAGEKSRQPQSRPQQCVQNQAGTNYAELSFEDKLKQFLQESDSKIAASKFYENRRGSGRRRRD